MEYQNIIKLLHNANSQLVKFNTKSWVEVNGKFCGRYNTGCNIMFKTIMLSSRLCNQWGYKHLKVTIKITGTETYPEARSTDKNSQLTFKNCTPFAESIKERNSPQVDNAKDLDVATLMYNLIESTITWSEQVVQ